MQHTYNLELASMEVPKLWIAGRYQSAQHLGCMGWSVYLSSFYILSVHHFLGTYGVNTLYLFHTMSAKHHSFGHWGEFYQCSLYGGFLDRGSGPKVIWSKCNCPTRKKSKRVTSHRDSGSVQQCHPENKVTGMAKSNNTIPGAQCKVELIPQQSI